MEVENNAIMDRTNYLPREPALTKQLPPKGDYASLVKKIFGKREENGKRYYLVQWKGFSISEATWEPSEKLGDIMSMIIDFEVEERWRQEHCKSLISMNEKRHADQDLSDDEGPKKFSKGEKGPQQTDSIKIEASLDESSSEGSSQHQASGIRVKAKKSCRPIEPFFEKERAQSLQQEEESSSYIPSDKSTTPKKKRGPGRPRKSEKKDQDEILPKSDEKNKPFTIIRTPIGRGRPRKDTFFAKFAELKRQSRAQKPPVARFSEKGKRLGRPPKPNDEQNVVEKKPLGRPKKEGVERKPPKIPGRGRGRPRKDNSERKDSSERIAPKKSGSGKGKGRGRPRKDGEPKHQKSEEEASSSEEEDDDEEGSDNVEFGDVSEEKEKSQSEDVLEESENEEVNGNDEE